MTTINGYELDRVEDTAITTAILHLYHYLETSRGTLTDTDGGSEIPVDEALDALESVAAAIYEVDDVSFEYDGTELQMEFTDYQ